MTKEGDDSFDHQTSNFNGGGGGDGKYYNYNSVQRDGCKEGVDKKFQVFK